MIESEGTLKIGIAGTGMIARAHVEALRRTKGAVVTAVSSRSEARAREFAEAMGIPRSFAPYEAMALSPDVDSLFVCTENHLHAPISLTAARAGKHIVVEKPLCFTLDEAEGMIAAAREGGVVFGYAENLCFAPKFVRAREICHAGGIGRVHMVRATFRHGGPYNPWFFDPDRAGGGAMTDLGCHAIELCRWALGKPAARSVYAQIDTVVPRDGAGRIEDHAVILVEFEGGALGQAEVSWVLQGGTDVTLEVWGTEGVVRSDLVRGSGLEVFSEKGYWPEGAESRGWTSPGADQDRNFGYYDQAAHFVSAMREGNGPTESGEDGLAVLEIMLAAFASSRKGRKIPLPFRPTGYAKPIDLWDTP